METTELKDALPGIAACISCIYGSVIVFLVLDKKWKTFVGSLVIYAVSYYFYLQAVN